MVGPDLGAREIDRGGVVGFAVLASTLSTSVLCGALVSRTDSVFEGFSWLHNVDAALCQGAPVEESVAGPIGEFDEAKSLLRTEPFYDATDRWTGGWFETGLTKTGSGSEGAGLPLVIVIVEFAMPLTPKLLISQFRFLGESGGRSIL
jgi:hypothetical protein